jgi:preprotein translocase subunit SecA
VTVSTQKDIDGDGTVDEVQVEAKGLDQSQTPAQLSYSAPSETGEVKATVARTSAGSEYENVGRNDECPCGSGKKFKKCHGDPANR